ncbi:MAG: citrate synthase family protein [Anaerolineales bacterium]|jgi:citrate synthase
MAKPTYFTAREAAAELGISRETLYSYVSRGLIRSEAVGGKPRQRNYRAEDIQRLKERKQLRRNPAKAAEGALNWGVPVLESGLTLISNGRLFYRGRDALDLALNSSIESVASLLWTGEIQAAQPERVETSSFASLSPDFRQKGLSPLHAFQEALIQAEGRDPAAFDLRPERVAWKGFSILYLLARIAVGINTRASSGIANILQSGWAPSRPQATRLFNAALILCADHELNVSAFTARCVASAGSSPYAAVVAGLAALQGVRHGGVTRRVAALFQEADTSKHVQTVLSERLQRGEAIPGFGHPLYPQGDPRARLLLEHLRETADSRQMELAETIARQTHNLIGELPTIDFALVCLARQLELPEDAAITLFAIGRTVGWIAHAIEQYQVNSLIRPRARYTGPQP